MKPDVLVPWTEPTTDEEKERFLEKLWCLLSKQTERYCIGDSTSIPMETAEELLMSICYTLQFEREISGLKEKDLLEGNLDDILKKGQVHLRKKLQQTRALWKTVYAQAELLGNLDIIEALEHLGIFFKKYDLYYFAHRTPWDLGILLLGPAIGENKGITYVEKYLESISFWISSCQES